MGKFCKVSTELWPLIYVKISFLGSILNICELIFFKLCKGVHIGKGCFFFFLFAWQGIMHACRAFIYFTETRG